jgi:hypothetical protein
MSPRNTLCDKNVSLGSRIVEFTYLDDASASPHTSDASVVQVPAQLDFLVRVYTSAV